MKTFLIEIKTSLLLTAVFALLLCGAYPLAVWAGGQVLFADKTNGSLIVAPDGTVRGSQLLAQNFASDSYFQPRPSAAGTNLGPTSQKLADSIKAAIAAYRTTNGLAADVLVPADAVTSSGSGLDPHISVANAVLQAARVAKARHLPLDQVQALVATHTKDRDWGIFGEPSVNVLQLNLALNQHAGS